MEILGFLLAVLAIVFVFAKLIFSSKAKTPALTELQKDQDDYDS